MLTAMTNSQRLKSVAWWVRDLVRQLLSLFGVRPARFAVLTPAFLAMQTIYDSKNKNLIRVRIRDFVDYLVIRQIFVHEDYGLNKLPRAKELDELYSSIVRMGKIPLIIDCGANCGMATRFFTETYKEALVIAVEPEPANMALAKANSTSKNVSYQLAGIGSSDTRANIQDPGQGHWAYRVEEDAGGSVSIISINSLLEKHGPHSYVPFIVKIDIEGFEAKLFETNTEWIDLFPILIIELHDWMLPSQANSRNFLLQISKRDRDFVFFGENVFSVANARS